MRSTYDIALRNMVTCRTVRTCRELYARATHSPTKQGFGLRCLQHTGRAIQKLVQCTSNGFIRGTLNLEPWTMAIDSPSLTRLGEAERTALRRDAIGFVFQAFHILPHLDLARNVAFPLILQKQPRTSALMRAGEMLYAVGLGDRRSSYPRELSGGELQRVAIARALVHAPGLILADEPTGNLDPDTAAQIIALLGRTVKERDAAMLLVTHSPLAAAMADRQLVLTPHGLVPADG